MNKITLFGISIIILASISNCYADARSDDYFKFADVPSTIDIEPGSTASFDVTIKNYGVQYADVDIAIQSLPAGITIVDSDVTKLIDTGKSKIFHITIAASNDMAPGTYHFEIADESPIDPLTWEVIEVRVKGESAAGSESDQDGGAKPQQDSPGFGAVAMASVLLLAYHLKNRT